LRLQIPADLPAARHHIHQSLELLRRMGDRQMQARALLRLSAVEFDAREIDAAQYAVEQASVLNRTLGNDWSLVYDLHHLGTICTAAGDVAAAQRHWQEGLATAKGFPHHPLAATLAQLVAGGA
jgi:predicted negative regulator of RcsB-dependent stress response